jgi:hypothetical protein
MKTCLSIIAIIFFCSFSRAQDDYERLFKLSKTWINTNEQAWAFKGYDVAVSGEFRDWHFSLYGDTLDLWFDDYYDGETETAAHQFRVCKLTNNELVLHPLNAEAVGLIDYNLGTIRRGTNNII